MKVTHSSNHSNRKRIGRQEEWTTSQYLLEAERLCKLKNIRFTSLRRNVFEIVLKNRSPIKPYDILDELKKPAYRKVTKPPSVYRCLNSLISGGVIHRLNSSGAYTYCTHPNRHRECFFLICRKCYVVEECCNPSISQLVDTITREQKYDEVSVTLEIEGLCLNCQKKAIKPNANN